MSDGSNTSDNDRLIVVGAGEQAVNGIYYRGNDGSNDDDDDSITGVGGPNPNPRYSKVGIWKGELRSFFLYRYSDREWYISSPSLNGRPPGCSDDLYFYKYQDWSNDNDNNNSHHHNNNYIPRDGWQTCYHCGRDPPPIVLVEFSIPGVDTISVPTPVIASYEKLLFSDDMFFKDVKIICNDGQVIAAHKNILAVSSPYFMEAFKRDREEKEIVELEVKYPSRIIKEVVSLLYTGKIDLELMKDEPLSFLSVATEFGIEWLKHLVEPYCIHDLNPTKLKDVWQSGRSLANEVLKRACMDYAKCHALLLLVNNEFTNLKVEDPASWDEFVKAIAPPCMNEITFDAAKGDDDDETILVSLSPRRRSRS